MPQPIHFSLLLAQANEPPPAAPAKPSGFDPSFFIALVIFIVAFIFLIDRPQKKRAALKAKAAETMKKGDKVITTSGIHGVIAKLDKEKDTIHVTVAKGVDLEFSRVAVNVVPEEKKNEKKDEKKGEIAAKDSGKGK